MKKITTKNNKTKVVAMRITEEEAQFLGKIAKAYKTNISEVARQYMRHSLDAVYVIGDGSKIKGKGKHLFETL